MSISFIILSFLTIIAGVFFYFPEYRYSALIAFIALVTLIPESNRITVNIASFNYYYFFPIVISPLLLNQNKRKTRFYLLLFLLVFIIYHTIFYLLNQNTQYFSFLVKDVFAIFLVVFALLIQNIDIEIDKKMVDKHLIIISLCALFVILISRFSSVITIDRVNAGGLFTAIFIYYISSEKKNEHVFILLLSIFSLIAVSSRTTVLIVFIIMLKESMDFGVKGLLIVIIPIIIWQVTPHFFKRDISTLLDSGYVYSYLFENRFSPFTEKLKEFNSISDYVLGKGVGSYFYIPWFKFGQFGHDNLYSPTIDNLYLTLFVKYGVFSLLIFYMILYSFKSMLAKNKKLYINSIMFILLYCFTNTYIYQFMFVPFVLTQFILNRSSTSYSLVKADEIKDIKI